ncbi:uncharacterized protein J3D65DRAFT_609740 [Phyllosticta citribraziliensis]|uniref:Inner kinetochore subunit AME1 domain-containing protein n=1 Tax=Phyllosticta citribraziliensis TaxID=989973 RepID=A0ABR1MB21_9PEZI
MRQRGAGTSGITGLNFGFTFGASATARQPTPRRTPRALPNQPNAQRTPLPIRRSSRRSSSKKATPSSQVSQRTSGSQNGSASRRTPRQRPASADARPQDEGSSSRANASLASNIAGDNVTTPTTVLSGRKRKRPSPVLEAPQENDEDELEQNDEAYTMSSVKSSRIESVQRPDPTRRRTTPSAMLEEAQDELDSHDGSHVLSSAKASGQTRSFIPETGLGGKAQQIVSPIVAAKKRPGRPRKSSGDAPALLGAAPSSTVVQKKRGRPPKAPPAQQDQDAAQSASKPLSAKKSAQRNISEPETFFDEADEGQDNLGEGISLGDIDAKAANGTRRVSRRSLNQAEFEDSEEEYDPSKEPSPERPPANKPIKPKRRGRKPKAPTSRSSEAQPKRQRARDEEAGETSTIPITIYRLSKAPRLTGNEGEDELANPRLEIPVRVPGVNAVDVLAEFMGEKMEDISARLREAVADEADKALRSKLKRQVNTVEEFGRELDSQLLHLREATYAGESLKARLKTTRKRREALTQEFLDIRKERDEIALRTDAVRRKYEEAEMARKRDQDLNAAIFDIELAVQRGKQNAERQGRQDEAPEMPLDWILDEVAGTVSLSGNGGGLLHKVKDFNAFLEQAAGVLEGRA